MLYVTFIFFFGLIVIFLFGFVAREKPFKSFSRKQPGSRASLGQDAAGPSPVATKSLATAEGVTKSLWKGSCVALGIMFVSAAFLHLWKPIPYSLKSPLSELPARIDGWVGRDISAEKGRQSLQPGDWVLHRVYQDPSGREFEVSIIYYSYQSQDREITDFRYGWDDWLAQIVPLHVSNEKIKIKEVRENRKHNVTRAYFWYDINGRILLNHYFVKGATILGGLTKRRTGGALVSIQARPDPGRDQGKTADELDFIRALFPIVREHLKQQPIPHERNSPL